MLVVKVGFKTVVNKGGAPIIQCSNRRLAFVGTSTKQQKQPNQQGQACFKRMLYVSCFYPVHVRLVLVRLVGFKSLQSQSLVRIVHHGQSVCDKDDRFIASGQNVAQQLAFGFGVESTCCFVEKHNATVS